MLGIGRKRRNDVWMHFRYIEVEKKTECIVVKEGKVCGLREKVMWLIYIYIYIYQLDGNVLSFLLTEVKTKTIVKIVND